MLIWPSILADDVEIGEGLFYVIAVLILSIVGAVFEKFKRKMAGDQAEKIKAKPKPRVPARPPVRAERPAAPPARPVVGGQQRKAAARPPMVQRRPRPPQRRRPVRVEKPPAQPIPVIVKVEAEPVIPLAERPALETEKGAEPSPASEPKAPAAKKKRVIGIGSFRNLSRDEIRRAIVLNEILGPPIALRDYERPWER
ncbi:MAG: hypothetical protein ACYTF1_22725 [Planctomycetota bacterium]|jgi:hypothetical protein